MFCSVMGETMKSNTVNQRFLTSVTTKTDVRRLNWCDYLLKCLKKTREGWYGTEDELSNGPLLLLVILYVYENEKSKANWCKQPNKLPYIDLQKLTEYEKKLFSLIEDDTMEESTDTVSTNMAEKDSRPSKPNLKVRIKVKKQKEVTKEAIEEIQGYIVETEEIRADLLRKELTSFDEHAKKFKLMLENAVNDYPESQLVQEIERDWESLINKYTTKKEHNEEQIRVEKNVENPDDVGNITPDEVSPSLMMEYIQLEKRAMMTKKMARRKVDPNEPSFKLGDIDLTPSTQEEVVEATDVEKIVQKDTILVKRHNEVAKSGITKKMARRTVVLDEPSFKLGDIDLTLSTQEDDEMVDEPALKEVVKDRDGEEVEEGIEVEKNVQEVVEEVVEGIDVENVVNAEQLVNNEQVVNDAQVVKPADAEKSVLKDTILVKRHNEVEEHNVQHEVELDRLINELPVLQTEESNFKTPDKEILCLAQPLSSVKPQQRKRQQRKKILPEILCSPFIERQVELNEKRTPTENDIANYIFAATGESM